jgi:hypothetical protein
MNHTELRLLLEAQAAAIQTERSNALGKMRGALLLRLAATVCNVAPGRLCELGELRRLAPTRFTRLLGEIVISFHPRHAVEASLPVWSAG